jgi:hypothetical protein
VCPNVRRLLCYVVKSAKTKVSGQALGTSSADVSNQSFLTGSGFESNHPDEGKLSCEKIPKIGE